jgi:DNA segregation ATPase FtsK/SpoIIIE-like protein
VENIEVYRQRTGKVLPSLFIIIDEFADLLDYFPYKERDEIEKILKRYGQMARAAGIHLILITQRATAQNIPGELRANLSGKVALRMYSEADSHYLLEEPGAEKITEPGVFLLKRGSNTPIRGYAPLIHKEDIEKLVQLALETFGAARYEPRLEKILSDIQIDNIISTTKEGLLRKGFFE